MRLRVALSRSARGRLVDGERVALAVRACRVPAHARDFGLRRRDRAAQLLHLLDRCLDRVDEDVVPGLVAGRLPALAEAAAQVTGSRRVEVVTREVPHLAELPAEDAAVEALRALLVVVRDLDVVVLAVSHATPPPRVVGNILSTIRNRPNRHRAAGRGAPAPSADAVRRHGLPSAAPRE